MGRQINIINKKIIYKHTCCVRKVRSDYGDRKKGNQKEAMQWVRPH